MRTIVKDIETEQLYILNCWENYIERMVDTINDGQQYIKYMVFHDFYYSAIDIHGRNQIPAVTMDYWNVFTSAKDTHIPNYFFQPDMSRASGWTYQLT